MFFVALASVYFFHTQYLFELLSQLRLLLPFLEIFRHGFFHSIQICSHRTHFLLRIWLRHFECLAPGSMSHCFHDWSSWYSVFGPWQTRWTLGYNECWTQVWIFPDLWIIHTIARLHLHKESCFLSLRSSGGEIIKKLLSVCLRSFDWLHSHLPFFRQQQTFSKSLPVY